MRVLAAAAISTAAVALAACGGGGLPPINESDEVLGSPDAPVEVIELASTACIHCADFAANQFEQFETEYIETGKVRYTMREIITAPADYAVSAFLLAECVGDDYYYPVLDALFISLWGAQGRMTDPRQPLIQVAAQAGMSEQEMNACITNREAQEALQDRAINNARYIPEGAGTPAFFINGEYYDGAPTAEAIGEAVDAAIAGE